MAEVFGWRPWRIVRTIQTLKSKRGNNGRLCRRGNLDRASYRRWRQAKTARRQRAPAPGAGQRAHQLGRRGLWPILLLEHCLAAGHVRHAAHAALVSTKAERHSGKRATEEHEQKEQRCEPLFHVLGHSIEMTNSRQPFNCAWTNIQT